jgi:hypothetical protein
MPANYEQLQARFRVDAATVDTAAVWGAALNTAWRRAPGSDFRVRFTIQTTGTSGAAAASTENLYVSKNAGAYVAIGGTSGILPSTTASASAGGTVILTAQLPAGTGVYVNGVYDSSGATASFTIPRGDYTEVEFGVKIDPANSAPGDTFDFRVYRATIAQNTYTATPRITSIGISLASGSYLLNPPAGNAGTVTFKRPNKNMPADSKVYAWNGPAYVTTSTQRSYTCSLAYAPFSYSGGPGTTMNYYATGGTGTPHPFPVAYATYAWRGPAYVTTSSTAGKVFYPDIGHYAWSPATQVTASQTGATHNIPLDKGSYAWSPATQVTTSSGQPATPDAGAYGVTIAKLNIDIIMNAGFGPYSVMGKPVTSLRTAVLGYRTFNVTGYSAAFGRTHSIALGNGPYSLTGPPLGFTKVGHYQMGADTGHYMLTGISPGINSSRAISLGYAGFTLSGRAVNMFSVRYFVNFDVGSYTLTGFSSVLDYTHRYMTLVGGSYSLAGQMMGFKSGPHTFYPTPTGAYGVIGPTTVIKSNRNMQLGYGSYAITGEPVPLTRSHLLSLTVGYYNSQGYQITIRRTYAPPIATGIYALSGPPLGLSKPGSRTLPLDSAAFSLTGRPITFNMTHTMSPVKGFYVVSGPSLTANTAHVLNLDIGYYSLTGQPITVKRGRNSVIAGGTYTLTGEPITLARNSHSAISLAGGSYALSGQAMAFSRGKAMVASGTLYVYTGQAITLKTGRAPMSLGGGTYALTGPAMTFKRIRVLVPNTGNYLTYGPSTIRLVGPGGKLGGQASAWPEIMRRRRRA